MKQIQKRGKKFTGTVRLNGHSVSLTFSLKSQASEWCQRVELAIKDELARGIPFDKFAFVPKKKEKPQTQKQIIEIQQIEEATPSSEWTLNRAIEEYKNTELESLKGFYQALNRLKAWQRHPFASLKLSELTPELIADYIKEKKNAGLSASTIRNNVYRISAIYELAKKPKTKGGWNLNLKNPVSDVSLPSLSGSRQRRLKTGEEARFLEAIKQGMYADELYIFCILAIETGMRKSEILSITKKEIHETPQGWSIFKQDTKNGENRTIFLSNRATDALKPLYEKLKDKTSNSRLFQDLTSNSVNNHIVRARNRAGLEDFRLHDLRHEAVSRLADKGLSAGAISMQSGHRSMQTLLRYMNASEMDVRTKLNQ
ncbi:site-specific integrase [Acetobacter orientalis]|uniref:site-specific integrase n=1 Tax=Acetobacter orientalis TaxID=146474 RepID=UPI0024201773|nr:site-specific integrase [Acetobacter orientalis]